MRVLRFRGAFEVYWKITSANSSMVSLMRQSARQCQVDCAVGHGHGLIVVRPVFSLKTHGYPSNDAAMLPLNHHPMMRDHIA